MTTQSIATYSSAEQLLDTQGYQPKSEQELLNHIYHIILGFFTVVSCKMYCYSNSPIKSELCFSVWVLVSKNNFFFWKALFVGISHKQGRLSECLYSWHESGFWFFYFQLNSNEAQDRRSQRSFWAHHNGELLQTRPSLLFPRVLPSLFCWCHYEK